MTLVDASALAQIIGAAAVVASLLFVGLQMRQNTRAVRASMSQAHAATYQEIAGRIYESEELTKIMVKGNFTPETLTDDERIRFMLLVAAQYRFYDATFTQFREGQLPEAHWRSMERVILSNGGNPGLREWWARRKETASDEFRTWYDAQIMTDSAPNLVPFATAESEAKSPS